MISKFLKQYSYFMLRINCSYWFCKSLVQYKMFSNSNNLNVNPYLSSTSCYVDAGLNSPENFLLKNCVYLDHFWICDKCRLRMAVFHTSHWSKAFYNNLNSETCVATKNVCILSVKNTKTFIWLAVVTQNIIKSVPFVFGREKKHFSSINCNHLFNYRRW